MSNTMRKHMDGMRLDEMHGMFVGLLTADEVKKFNKACDEGKAMRSYTGAGGVMGLARVRLLNEEEQAQLKLHRECRR
jgi:hypothetical protein